MKTFSLPRVVFVTLLLGSSVVPAGDWTRFQGPMPSDVDVTRLPMTWGPKENIAWTADIAGYRQSSPVTFGDRVFVTSISGPKKELCHVAAFDLNSGKKGVAARSRFGDAGREQQLHQQGGTDSRG